MIVDVMQAIYLTGNVTTLALVSNLARKQVRNSHKAGALVWLERQSNILRTSRGEYGPGKLRVKVFAERTESDSTKHCLKLKSHPLLSNAQQRSSWELVVTLWEVQWVDEFDNFYTLDLVLVPGLAVGKSNASCYWDAIFDQEINADCVGFVVYMRRISEKAGSVREPDSASVMFRTFQEEMWKQSRAFVKRHGDLI